MTQYQVTVLHIIDSDMTIQLIHWVKSSFLLLLDMKRENSNLNITRVFMIQIKKNQIKAHKIIEKKMTSKI